MIEAATPTSPPTGTRPQARVFQSLTISAVRLLVARRAFEAGMDAARTRDLVLAVCELASNCVRHAGGAGVVRIWQEEDALVCEVANTGRPDRRLAGRDRPVAGQEGGYGLWIADQLCDRIESLQTAIGTVFRVRMRLRAA